MNILLATNNTGKIERFKKLINATGLNVELYTPRELGIEALDTEENGATLAANAELKVRAYAGKTDLPILANDTGFFVEGEGLIDAPKRVALRGADESLLTQEDITAKLLEFWKGVARKYGGKVDAAWVEAFALLYPDGRLVTSDSRREVTLTDHEFGTAHPQMPVRALYYSKTTNKPSLHHTEEEEMQEMQPVIAALKKVLTA